MKEHLLTIFTAYLLDLIIGDPQWSWHPVRLMGRLIEKMEHKLNTDKINRVFSGLILVVLTVGITIFCIWLILKLAKAIQPILYHIICTVLIYFSLSIKSLAVEANKVYSALKNKNIPEARRNLSLIVGRDTDTLAESAIIRATVETVAESSMDGIIAPLFYACLAGPIGAWTYKAINTLDSMVGYKNERFREFGKVSAKLDGLANLIPAKITCFLISVSSLFFRKDWLNSVKWGLKYAFKGQEFNSTATEAAMAGALKIRLGGLNFYNSVPVNKPFIGDEIHPLAIKHIRDSIQIAYVSSALMLILETTLLYGLGGL